MTKTLADMSAEERAECVGMWCEVGNGLEILAEPDGMVDYHDTAIMHSAKRNGGAYVLADAITPRFDLPRAWTPDGEPVFAQALAEETWEYAVQVSNGSKWLFLGPHPGGYRTAKGAHWFKSKEMAQSHRKFVEYEYFDTRIVRRRVSEPEVVG